jgi:hypothetical protein
MRPVLEAALGRESGDAKKGVRIKQKAKRQKVYDVDRPSSESDIPEQPNPIGTESEG